MEVKKDGGGGLWSSPGASSASYRGILIAFLFIFLIIGVFVGLLIGEYRICHIIPYLNMYRCNML